MPKLHEILAVDGSLKRTSIQALEEGVVTFTKRTEHFSGHEKVYIPKDDTDPLAIEAGVTERSEMVTTVADKLRFVFDNVIKHIDTMASKDATNQLAKADIVVDGTTIASDVPAVTLLSLETELVAYRSVLAAIPTLPPGKAWEEAADLGPNIFRMKYPEKKTRTRRGLRNHIRYEHTPEHPAQVETYTEDNPIGVYETSRTSGAVTPARKSVLIGRVDSVLRGVKKARQRANGTKVEQREIGKSIVDFLLSD